MKRVPLVHPRSRNDLELIAREILQDFSPAALKRPIPFDVERFCDVYLARKGFDIDLVELGRGIEGLTDPINRKISIPPSTHEMMQHGDGRSRFTIVHEGVHGIVHADEVKETLVTYGSGCYFRRSDIPRFRDPEWQANYVTGALLMPEPLMVNMLGTESFATAPISKMFKVSYSAAETRIGYINMRLSKGEITI